MTYDEIRTAWNAQADEHNQWDELGEDEKIEWAASIAAAKVVGSGVGQEGWAPVSERLPGFMDSCDWLMPMTEAKRERWILANESMATASVPGVATHWRKAQALPELTGHQPPVVKESLTTESTVNQKATVQVPPFTHTALHKLDDLLAQGFRITGYAIERTDVADWAPQRGFVTHGGLVGWWTPHQIDRIPGAQHGQPT